MIKHPSALFTVLALSITACGPPDSAEANTPPDGAPVTAVVDAQDLPAVLVYKSASCGCCNGWVEHMRAAGFQVETRDVRDLMAVKIDAGVPTAMSSCHTALIDGYAVEGHVPAEQIKRMLAERPDIAGLGVPGMPTGSPGMEGPRGEPYQVLSWDHQGQPAIYAEIDPR
ncbi:MAG: DUF411 domain-containing protein [Gemmatimonadetes bacterium]|nr:DUF411 domain-containing protein [Gemmatimonadota bacterium]